MTRWKTPVLTLLSAIAFCVGCGVKTIYVRSGEPVRLRQEIENCLIWVRDAEGTWVPSMLDIPEGWYALPDPGN